MIKEMSKYYEIIAYTASLKEYADAVINEIDSEGIIKIRLFREYCRIEDYSVIKDLSILGRNLKDVVIVDN